MNCVSNRALGHRVKFVVQCLLLALNLHCVIANDEISFNVKDILSTQMMPLHIFVDRFKERFGQKYTKDFLSGLHTMNFHRKMMQQYMASNYLSNQMLNWNFGSNELKIKNRIGKLQNISNAYNDNGKTFRSPIETVKTLLYDDGSAKYNAWLRRTTTLDDIQHQLNNAVKHSKNKQFPIRRQMSTPAANSTMMDYYGGEEIDYGDITGYAYDGSHNDSNYLNVFPHKVTQLPRFSLRNPNFGVKMRQISKTGYENSIDDYAIHETPPEHSSVEAHPTKQVKEINIKDITDIALTTLAFLSFGMFILQVLMCITMSKDEGNSLMMLPMEATEPVETNDGTEEIRRRKRSIQQNPAMLIGINQLTHNLLMIIDHFYLYENKRKNMKYYFKLFCGYASPNTEATYNQKLWTTLYSLGSSWLASRMSDDYFSTIKHIAQVLEVCT